MFPVLFSIRFSRAARVLMLSALEGGKGQRAPAEDVGKLDTCLQHYYDGWRQVPKQEGYTCPNPNTLDSS